MGIYNFGDTAQRFVSAEDVPDFRSPAEQFASPNSVYNPQKPDYGYVERMAMEFMNISGAIVTIYPKLPDMTEGIDQDFDEDAHPQYGNGIITKAYFKPEPKRMELKKFGIDTLTSVTLVFSRAQLMMMPEIGDRLLLPGDVIKIPYNHVDEIKNPMMVRVLNATPMGNFHYRWIYHQVTCEPITGDELVAPRNE